MPPPGSGVYRRADAQRATEDPERQCHPGEFQRPGADEYDGEQPRERPRPQGDQDHPQIGILDRGARVATVPSPRLSLAQPRQLCGEIGDGDRFGEVRGGALVSILHRAGGGANPRCCVRSVQAPHSAFAMSR